VPNKFHVHANVTGYAPTPIYFTQPFCANCQKIASAEEEGVCSSCLKEASEFAYMFQLKLQDETGTSVEAIVFGEDGARFFHGLPPVNLAQNNISLTAIQAS